ncbi:MAG: hypothetical protein WKF47_16410 [Geodermatophilaceae bacterium]
MSHRMPEGTVYMYHAQDRLIDVPRSETSGKRGGIHNSLTRLLIKPSHLIGGYAPADVRVQLPRPDRQPARRGHRHPHAAPRRCSTDVQEWSEPMRPMAQMAMVMNLDKCIGCHTCSVTCKQAWTNRSRRRVRLVQQRRDPTRAGLSPDLRGPGEVAGRLGA